MWLLQESRLVISELRLVDMFLSDEHFFDLDFLVSTQNKVFRAMFETWNLIDETIFGMFFKFNSMLFLIPKVELSKSAPLFLICFSKKSLPIFSKFVRC